MIKRKIISRIKKKKKGFTLIELLAVILILGIIALIAVPTVNSIVKEARRKSFEQSVQSFDKSISNKIVMSGMNDENINGFYSIKKGESTIGLDLKGEFNVDGIFFIAEDGKYSYAIEKDDMCALKSLDGELFIEMSNGLCSLSPDGKYLLNEPTPEELFEYSLNYDKKTVAITGYKAGGTITDYSLEDEKIKVNKYEIDDEKNLHVVIPEKINGKPVTKIGSSAFKLCNVADEEITTCKDNTYIKSVIIPNSVTNIDNYAFEYNGLETVLIGDSVDSISVETFANNNITYIKMGKSVRLINSKAFYNSLNVQYLELPELFRTVGVYGFQKSRVKELVFKEGITSIGDHAFDSCKIEKVELPNSLTTIAQFAFAYSGLKSLIIPDSVTSIGQFGFACNDFDTIVIGKNVSKISHAALYKTLSDTNKCNRNFTKIINKSEIEFNWQDVVARNAMPFDRIGVEVVKE